MKSWLTGCVVILFSLAAIGAGPADDLSKARSEIAPLLKAMQDAANAHDAAKHVSFYAKDPNLLFVINDRAITGFDPLLEQQKQWWQNGSSDVVYTMVGEPDYRMPGPGLVMVTYFLTSRRTDPSGAARNTRLGISALWQHRPEGWRIIYAHESTVNQ
jgi:ketosteroid isomerase-like protein